MWYCICVLVYVGLHECVCICVCATYIYVYIYTYVYVRTYMDVGLNYYTSYNVCMYNGGVPTRTKSTAHSKLFYT